MSKYIRTNDGIYEVGEKVIVEPNNNPNISRFPNESGYYITRKNFLGGIDFNYVGESEIIKEAGTIEELCNEFVAHWKDDDKEFGINGEYYKRNNDKRRYFQYENVDEMFLAISYYTGDSDRLNIYGAIWTDKGLIYVAKMNKDGKLELI